MNLWDLSRIEYAVRDPAERGTNIKSENQLARKAMVWLLGRHVLLGMWGGVCKCETDRCAGGIAQQDDNQRHIVSTRGLNTFTRWSKTPCSAPYRNRPNVHPASLSFNAVCYTTSYTKQANGSQYFTVGHVVLTASFTHDTVKLSEIPPF